MLGKAAVSAISVILVVGVALAIVGVVQHQSSSKSDSGSENQISTQQKAVSVFCGKTDYQEICQKTLTPVADQGVKDPKEFVKAALQSTINEVSKALNFSDTLITNVSSSTPRVKMEAEDCKDLLEFAVDELQSSFSMVGDSNINNMTDKATEIKNWLSAVISYQTSCLDGLSEAPEFQSLMSKNLQNASSLTSNALAIVSELGAILKAYGLELNVKPSSGSRRLLGEDGYPTWFSASDRKLLAASPGTVRPNAVVAKDGSGQYKTISAALAAYPKNLRGRYIIYVKAGVYNEYITVTKNQKNVFIYGDGPRKTIVTGNKSNKGGFSTFKTASFCKYNVTPFKIFNLKNKMLCMKCFQFILSKMKRILFHFLIMLSFCVKKIDVSYYEVYVLKFVITNNYNIKYIYIYIFTISNTLMI